ncbi:putative proline--tRNA ligase, mitochondrial [Gigaspora margarita]|uniref:proline--tRNA ligase n=1 Tax=Gigaspora margarita TaxID=4874 RepID=A0A8H4AEW0_GIGMA|nr:putative proline--tRNA ligase, mitochondrial [Gigaspora margarita]
MLRTSLTRLKYAPEHCFKFSSICYDNRACLSKVFLPTINDTASKTVKDKKDASTIDNDGTFKGESHKLMIRAGLIRQSSSGVYSLLPFALRSIEKIEKIIDQEMRNIGAQKLSLPILLSANMWKRTGRWDTTGSELFKLKDRKTSDFCLAPTHEEEITQLVANDVFSYRQLPLRLYQIGRKFRDEMRPRAGLLRGREFIMKDLYTFDTTEETALKTYEEAEADTGNIGGTKSHEYHILSAVGEDLILSCMRCGYTSNEERAHGLTDNDGCPVCYKDSITSHDSINFHPLKSNRAIEVGHTFLLGTKYSDPLKATFASENPLYKGELLSIQMGCYGIGVSRMIAAIIESSHDSKGIIWPPSVAPYRVCIIPGGDEPEITEKTRSLYDFLTSECDGLNDEVLIDDRMNLSFGYRMKDAELLGYPWLMIIGKKFLESGKIEIHNRHNNQRNYLEFNEIKNLFIECKQI